MYRKDSFITHRAFCDALAEETARLSAAAAAAQISINNNNHPSNINSVTETPFNIQQTSQNTPSLLFPFSSTNTWIPTLNPARIKPETIHNHQQLFPAISPTFYGVNVSTVPHHASSHLSATALLQKAATVGAVGDHVGSKMSGLDMGLTSGNIATWQKTDRLTRDFLGLTSDQEVDHHGDANVSVRNMLTYTGGIEIPAHGFGTTASEAWGNC